MLTSWFPCKLSNNLIFFWKLFWNGWHFQPFFNGIEYVLVHMNDRILNNYFQGYTGPWTNSFFIPNWEKNSNEQSDKNFGIPYIN